MPAPLAKGIIVSISLLLAAGLAVYEHPQVKQWVDQSRRKIAFALHNLGDDLDPPSSRRDSSQDASTREDNSPEAAERRRRARQEILERGRMMEEKRKSQQTKSKSFDDLVDEGGKLKPELTHASTSAAQSRPEQQGLRNRHIDTHEAALAHSQNPFADQFTDDTHLQDYSPSTAPVHTSTQRSRSSSTATLPAYGTPPPVPPKEPLIQSPSEIISQDSQTRLLIDTDDVSNHPSEALVDLTPTTSASSIVADLSELEQQPPPSTHSQTNFWSVHEWAENTSAPVQFHTTHRSETIGELNGYVAENSSSEDGGSETGSGERIGISRIGSMSEMDMMSEVGGISTPGSWSEVGSRVSEGY
ncbi:MAG: hypothetical protein Q9170_003297 [Blastenia crenularia]